MANLKLQILMTDRLALTVLGRKINKPGGKKITQLSLINMLKTLNYIFIYFLIVEMTPYN